jgi:Fe-S oxidoreductase
MQQLIFVVFLAAAFGFFGRTIYVMARAARRGVDDPRPRFDQLPARLMSVLVYFIGQKKVAEEGPLHMTSKHHLLIFWGFLIIQIGTVEMLIAGVWPGFSLDVVMPDVLYTTVKWAADVANLVVLIIIGWALFRRIVVKPHLIPMSIDAGLILGAIAALMISHFLYHGTYIAAGHEPAAAPVSSMVAGWVGNVDAESVSFIRTASLWLHLTILLIFLNYLPFSKHIHLLGALPNIFLRNLSERRLDMPKLDLEDENQWGVGRVEQFSWKSLVDNYACTECARCTNYCPAYATEKNLSPMQLVHDIRYEMIDRDALWQQIEETKKEIASYGPQDDDHKSPELEHLEHRLGELEGELEAMPPMVGGRIAEDTLWSCTTCGACQEVCPVFIEHPLKILQMRQNLVLEQEKTPGELGRAFRNIERQSNPWGISNEKRMEWADGLDVPTIEDKPNPEYILWVGCAGAFDNRIVKQTRAMVKVLDAAGVDYAVLGHAEGCTGDPARRGGNEFLFQMMAETNIETLNEAGVKKVIASCPHCLHTLRHDYPQFGGDYEVIHHTQLIGELLKDGALKIEPADLGSMTYHDSCYLGRWNREFDAPRDVVNALNSKHGITELKRNKRHGFCCGAGGARMFMEEDEPRVNTNRTDEIIEAGVETVAVACPFCNIMITDGMKSRNKEEDIKVLDVAELVAESIPDVPVSSLTRKRDRGEAS